MLFSSNAFKLLYQRLVLAVGENRPFKETILKRRPGLDLDFFQLAIVKYGPGTDDSLIKGSIDTNALIYKGGMS